MATADRDGRMARWLSDATACLSIEMHEALLEAERNFPTPPTPERAGRGRGDE